MIDNKPLPVHHFGAYHVVSQLRTVVEEFWQTPDWLGVEVVLGFMGAFQMNERVPFWLHIVGGPGTGKTDLGLATVEDTHAAHHKLDLISANAFISGFTEGEDDGKANSYLHRIGDSGLISMGDFTTIMEQPEHAVKEIAGQLRRIFDGSLSKQTGVHNPNGEWHGNLSIVTAMTPAAFARWNRYNEMGERFLALQWRGPEMSEATYAKVVEQAKGYRRGVTTDIMPPRQRLANLTNWLLMGEKATAEWPTMYPSRVEVKRLPDVAQQTPPDYRMEILHSPGNSVFKMGEIVAWLRMSPKRLRGGRIGTVTNFESPTRVQHQLLKAIRGYAFMLRREVEVEDLRIARRLAWDSLPVNRTAILKCLGDGKWHTQAEIMEVTGYKHIEPLESDLTEMLAIGAVTTREPGVCDIKGADAEIALSDKTKQLIDAAFGGIK